MMAAPAKLVRTVYRALCREARRLEKDDHTTLRLPPPMKLEQIATRYGRGSYGIPIPAFDLQQTWFPKLKLSELSPAHHAMSVFDGAAMRKIVQLAFRQGGDLTIDDGIAALSTINR